MYSFSTIAIVVCLCAVFLISVVDFSEARPGGGHHGGHMGMEELLVAGLIAKMFQQGHWDFHGLPNT